MISYPGVKIDKVMDAMKKKGKEIDGIHRFKTLFCLELSPITKQTISIEYKYEPYIEKELSDIEVYKRNHELEIPESIDYMKLPISQEERDKLSTVFLLNVISFVVQASHDRRRHEYHGCEAFYSDRPHSTHSKEGIL